MFAFALTIRCRPAAASGSGSHTVTWSAGANEAGMDGPLATISFYTVKWGTSPGVYTNTYSTPDATTLSYLVTGLASGTWYFAVTETNAGGVESDPSFEDYAVIP